jgi:transposase InsO family protein
MAAAFLSSSSNRTGVQYASGDYRHALSRAGLIASMSRSGNCYDNAAMESFWSTLKLELYTAS